MKKKISLILVGILSLGIMVSCSNGNKETEVETKEIKVVVPDGLPSIAMAKTIKENKEIEKGYNTTYSIEKTPENIVSEVLKGGCDIAVVPSNVAATQYNKNSGYVIASTLGWGSLYFVSTEGEKTFEEVKGKEIYNIGRGLTPDLIARSLLKDNNLDADTDFKFSYVNGVTELAPTVIADKTSFAILPEPALSQVLAKNKKAVSLLSLNDEWKKANNSEYGFPQSTIIVKKELYDNNKEYVEKFLTNVKESASFAKDKNKDLPDYCEEIGVSTNKDIILNAMDNSNIKYVPIKDCYKEYVTYFNKLNELDPKSIGGKVPDEGVYMEK